MREDPTSFEPWAPSGDGVPKLLRGLSVTEAAVQDVDACIALSMLVSDGSGVDWSALFHRDNERSDRYLVVARVDEKVIGYARTARFEPDAEAPANAAPAGYYLIGLVVDPGWRRQGVATALIQARLTWVAQRAYEAWYFADISNRVSIGLHEQAGFATVTDDFWFPTVTDGGGTHVLGSVQLPAG